MNVGDIVFIKYHMVDLGEHLGMRPSVFNNMTARVLEVVEAPEILDLGDSGNWCLVINDREEDIWIRWPNLRPATDEEAAQWTSNVSAVPSTI